FRFEMEPAGTGLSQLREQYGKPLLAVMSISGMLLLIACTNVASMLLARGAAREAEMGLRVTLGASRSRLFGESVTESMILSIASGIMGVALAYFGTGALVRMIVSARHVGAPLDLHVRVDSSVLLFASTLVVVTGFLIGLVPALRALRRAPASSLREMATAGGRRSRNLGKGLVVIQVALSVVLLSAAVLFVGRLSHLEHINLGFRRDHVLLMKLDAENSGYDNEQLSRAYQDLLQRLKDIPGVRSATLSASTPISGAGANRGVTVEGYEAKPGELRNVMENWVAPKYFETLGTPLLLGRDFEFEERGGRVAIINQTMARYYFGNTNPIRRHVTFDRDAQPYEIIGVVGDAKYIDIREPIMRTIYLNTFQHTHVASQLVLRTSNDPVAVVSDVRRAVNGILVGVTVKRVTTLSDQIDESIVPERLVAVLSGWFGSLGLLLAALGLYGLLAYTVTRRINEIGIRMALGATGAEVARTVLHDAFLMVFSGLLIGTPLEFWGRKMALSLVPELPSGSVLLLVSGVVAMMAVALLAAYLPASRAASVDPMEALRYE
ncbi:MAG TPA: FtsX-like permease family protein, partial [Terriglobales bacterium]|nr:FtsX-like permease family protein [Terriglobales bacterium]